MMNIFLEYMLLKKQTDVCTLCHTSAGCCSFCRPFEMNVLCACFKYTANKREKNQEIKKTKSNLVRLHSMKNVKYFYNYLQLSYGVDLERIVCSWLAFSMMMMMMMLHAAAATVVDDDAIHNKFMGRK